MLRRVEHEILGQLELKHAIEDVLSSLHDRASVSSERQKIVAEGLASLFDRARQGSEAAAQRSLLLAPGEDAAVRSFTELERVFKLKGVDDVAERLQTVSDVLHALAENEIIDQDDQQFAQEILGTLLEGLRYRGASGLPEAPREFAWER